MTVEKIRSIKFLSPQYWPIWIGVGLLYCVNRLPYTRQQYVGKLLGIFMYHLSKKRRRIVKTNLRLCFPELDKTQRAELLRKHFKSLGLMLIEIGISWWVPRTKIESLIHIDGLEHIKTAQQSGRGIILVTSHFTTLELASIILSTYVPLNVMNRRSNNALLGALIEKGRRKYVNLINKDDVRAMVTTLKNGDVVWYAPDQNYRGKGSIDVPFFGIPTPTNSATSRIAKMTNALVIPFFINRLERSNGYIVKILPALDNFPSDDTAADILHINQIFEKQIRKYPEQYLWIHRRFKGRDKNISVYD